MKTSNSKPKLSGKELAVIILVSLASGIASAFFFGAGAEILIAAYAICGLFISYCFVRVNQLI